MKIFVTELLKLATYGNGPKIADITDIVNRSIDSGCNLYISNDTFKTDPIIGKVKYATLIFSSGIEYKIPEGSTIEFEYIDDSVNLVDSSINECKYTASINSYPTELNYILSTNVRDEDNILEWIIYHLMIGFDKILIIDHKSLIPVTDIIAKYKFEHRVKVIRINDDECIKCNLLNNIVLPYMKKNCKKYFIHLDGDEYLNLNNKYNTIKDFLDTYSELNIDVVVLNWLYFGSNNKLTNDNIYKSILPTYTMANSKLDIHFKCFVKIKPYAEYEITNPHVINIKNTIVTYVNAVNSSQRKQIQYNPAQNIFMTFEELYDNTAELSEYDAIINHYFVQSTDTYEKRRIYRNRDDTNKPYVIDNEIDTKYNEITYDNLNNNFSSKITDIIENNKFSVGFIILRYINSVKTNEAWQKCYQSIRKFYNNKILIIDDYSNMTYYKTTIELVNCTVINSQYRRRGEILPYYYYLKNKFCDRVVILHDSMEIVQYIDFNNITNYKYFTRLFTFNNNSYKVDINYFEQTLNYMNNNLEVLNFHNNHIDTLLGCFGVCCVMDWVFLDYLNNTYNIENLINYINTRSKRKTLERVFSCLIEKAKNELNIITRSDLLGSIHNNLHNMENNMDLVYIVKRFFSR